MSEAADNKRSWIAPSVMFIESAADTVKQTDAIYYPGMLEQQDKELTSFGDTRAQAIGATGLSNDFRIGYRLALQVSRTAMSMSAEIRLKGVDPTKVL